MEGNEFANGLLGHRVEGYLAATMGKGLVQGIWIGVYQDTESQLDRIVDDNGDILLITATRVIRPQKEVVKPAEPYDLNNIDHLSRIECLLKESGFEVDTFPPYAYMYAIKQGHTVHIDTDGVRLTNKGVRISPNIPLNEWVKNPTIESLKPKG